MLDFRQIQNFVAVAERLNISRAAEVVHLSQPALSRQMQALEKRLGLTLFERVGNRLVLTAEGEDLLRGAVALIDQAQHLVDRSQKLQSGSVGLLRVGATSQTIARLVSPTMVRFRESYPLVDVILSEGDNDSLLEMVDTGVVHVAVAAFSNARGLAGTKLFEAALRLVVPPGHRLEGASAATIADIADEHLMLLRRGFLTRQLFDLTCASSGLRPNILLESDSAETLACLADDGHGIAVVSTSARPVRDAARTIALHNDGAPIKGDVYAVWKNNRSRPACLADFVSCLARQAAPGGPAAGAPPVGL
ncbi:hypothetical protein DLJ53_31330 [Acuticoccus sediminis]|uniref:HTH lysR-type domain-containing protein n=1 Tax=Acuticoccus sediminis TaxID=2184697 RepID=A0A8B2NL29_9HYPH|nr:LysR family transcriptional regulator [Acuticoccus sediminis]RAH96757.1 hypothetical protein DLJ53_31330 [Acuticoccus sediminis]